MEYYYFEPVGILLSQESNDKEQLLSLLNEAYNEHPDEFLGFLRKHKIQRVFTFVAPKFKFGFHIVDDKVVEKEM